MDASENPYAAPRTSGVIESEPRDRSLRRHPWFSRALTIMLMLNVFAVVASIVMLLGVDYFFPRGLDKDVPLAVLLSMGFLFFWLMVAWPIISLTATIYTATFDRGTQFWLLRTVVSALMLVAWLAVCLLGIA